MKPVQVTRYQAEDGSLFDSSVECDQYERAKRFEQALDQIEWGLESDRPASIAQALAKAGYKLEGPL